MSVRKVKAINIIGLLSELDKVIKFCGDSESFHPDDAMSFYSNTQDFIPMSDKNPYRQTDFQFYWLSDNWQSVVCRIPPDTAGISFV